MKICLLARYFDFRNAGLGRIALEISQRLEERGHEVLRVASNADSLWDYGRSIGWRIKKKIPRDYDVYHALTPLEAMHTPRYRTVVTFNDLIPITHASQAGAGQNASMFNRITSAIVFGTFSYLAVQRVRRVVTISDHVADEVARLFPVARQDITVIRLGIRPDLRPRRRVRQPVRTIGYLGQLDRRKRVDVLIEAFLAANTKARLLIGGVGPQAEALKELAAGDERITFLGLVPDVEMAKFYDSLDLLAFPTAIEGYGLPPVEAMACEVPVVALADAIIPEDVKRHCWVTDDLTAFLRAFQGSRVDGVSPARAFAQLHDWEKTVDVLEQVYQEVIE